MGVPYCREYQLSRKLQLTETRPGLMNALNPMAFVPVFPTTAFPFHYFKDRKSVEDRLVTFALSRILVSRVRFARSDWSLELWSDLKGVPF